MQNDTISALRFVKDELNRVGGVLNFPIIQNLITQVKGARAKYMADLEEKNRLRQEVEKRIKESQAAISKAQIAKTECEKIDSEIKKCEVNLKVANKIVEDGNKQLQDVLSKSKLDRNKIQQAQSKIETGLERKRKIENKLHSLQQKRKKFQIKNLSSYIIVLRFCLVSLVYIFFNVYLLLENLLLANLQNRQDRSW